MSASGLLHLVDGRLARVSNGEGFSMRAAAWRWRLGLCRPALKNLARRKPRGLGATYGESVRLAVTGGHDSSNRVGATTANDVMRAGPWGRLPLCLGDFAVFGKAW